MPVFAIAFTFQVVLDLPTIPVLGFAFFIPGYPRPQKIWPNINPVDPSPTDARSDGHIYKAMMPQLMKEMQRIVTSDPFSFDRGSFYFMKNEKMIALIHVLERGSNYIVFSVKGTELQETTVCHAEENENINEITERLFEK